MAKTSASKKAETPAKKPATPVKAEVKAEVKVEPKVEAKVAQAKVAQAKPVQSRLAIPKRVETPSPSNFAFEWKSKQDGSGEVVFAYEGPLAKREDVVAHVGTWREGGEPWSGQLELHLRREAPGRFVGALPVSPGAPLRAVEIALRHGDSWDNGGRAPLGYYEWRVGENQVTAV